MLQVKKSTIAVAIALGAFAGSASAAIDFSGEAKLGYEDVSGKKTYDAVTNKFVDHGDVKSDRIGEVKLVIGINQEITPDLTFAASPEISYDVDKTEDQEVKLGGSVSMNHTTFGSFEFGKEVGDVFTGSAFASEASWSEDLTDTDDHTWIGYKYTNTFGPLSVSLGYWDADMDASELVKDGKAAEFLSRGWTGNATYEILEGLKVGASFADRQPISHAGNLNPKGIPLWYMAGIEYADAFLPGLTLAANFGSFGDVDKEDKFYTAEKGVEDRTEVFLKEDEAILGYGLQASYKIMEDLSVYASYGAKQGADTDKYGVAKVDKDNNVKTTFKDDFKVGANFAYDITPGAKYALLASYSTGDEELVMENSVTVFDGLKFYANVTNTTAYSNATTFSTDATTGDVSDSRGVFKKKSYTEATLGAEYTIKF